MSAPMIFLMNMLPPWGVMRSQVSEGPDAAGTRYWRRHTLRTMFYRVAFWIDKEAIVKGCVSEIR